MQNKFYLELGKTLQDKRQAKGYSQQYVADRTGMTRSCYAFYEQGRRKITIDDLFKVAEVLDIDPNELLKNARKYAWSKWALKKK